MLLSSRQTSPEPQCSISSASLCTTLCLRMYMHLTVATTIVPTLPQLKASMLLNHHIIPHSFHLTMTVCIYISLSICVLASTDIACSGRLRVWSTLLSTIGTCSQWRRPTTHKPADAEIVRDKWEECGVGESYRGWCQDKHRLCDIVPFPLSVALKYHYNPSAPPGTKKEIVTACV